MRPYDYQVSFLLGLGSLITAIIPTQKGPCLHVPTAESTRTIGGSGLSLELFGRESALIPDQRYPGRSGEAPALILDKSPPFSLQTTSAGFCPSSGRSDKEPCFDLRMISPCDASAT